LICARRYADFTKLEFFNADGTPGTKVFIEIDKLDSLHHELMERQNRYMRPGFEDADWGRILTVIDPFGNRLILVAKAFSKEQELIRGKG